MGAHATLAPVPSGGYLGTRLAIPLPHSGPLALAPVHTPIGCQVFERQVFHPWDFSPEPQEFFPLPTFTYAFK